MIQQNLNNPDFIIIDVRTLTEFNSEHIAGAINIDYESPQFTVDVSKLDKNKQYLVYCLTGVRGASNNPNNVKSRFQRRSKYGRRNYRPSIQDGYPVSGTNNCRYQQLRNRQQPRQRKLWEISIFA